MSIRNAVPKDAHQTVPLLMDAMGELAYMFSGTPDLRQTIHVLEQFFIEETTRTSHKNCIVYEENNVVRGVMVFYGGDRREALDCGILDYLQRTENPLSSLDRECFEDEFYIDSLAVDEAFRNRGIATKLFNYAIQDAIKEGFTKISLLVDSDNTTAQQYYKNLGFAKDVDLVVNHHLYYHLVLACQG